MGDCIEFRSISSVSIHKCVKTFNVKISQQVLFFLLCVLPLRLWKIHEMQLQAEVIFGGVQRKLEEQRPIARLNEWSRGARPENK